MSTKEELITAFRKEAEDLTQAIVRNIFKAKYGEDNLIIGDTTIILPIDSDTAYATAEEYDVRFHSAVDTDGIDIKEAIYIKSKTASAFVINSPLVGTVRWETFLKVPNFNFWTSGGD